MANQFLILISSYALTIVINAWTWKYLLCQKYIILATYTTAVLHKTIRELHGNDHLDVKITTLNSRPSCLEMQHLSSVAERWQHVQSLCYTKFTCQQPLNIK